MYTNILAASLLAGQALAAPAAMYMAPRNPAVPAAPAAPAANASTPAASTPAAPAMSASASPAAGGASGGAYTTFKGDGSVGAGWPDNSKWVQFEAMFAANQATMQASCTNLGGGANNSPTETSQIKDAINSVAGSNGVDPRFVLAVVMQESKGCVRVPTTANAHPNPGLMQGGGTNTCNSGKPVNPCPQNLIQGMISDGVTAGGAGLKDTLAKATGAASGQKTYQAAYLYNSGINEPLGDLAAAAATACYASDIANRLTGFLGDSPCKE